jgi:hypothetical protein
MMYFINIVIVDVFYCFLIGVKEKMSFLTSVFKETHVYKDETSVAFISIYSMNPLQECMKSSKGQSCLSCKHCVEQQHVLPRNRQCEIVVKTAGSVENLK